MTAKKEERSSPNGFLNYIMGEDESRVIYSINTEPYVSITPVYDDVRTIEFTWPEEVVLNGTCELNSDLLDKLMRDTDATRADVDALIEAIRLSKLSISKFTEIICKVLYGKSAESDAEEDYTEEKLSELLSGILTSSDSA